MDTSASPLGSAMSLHQKTTFHQNGIMFMRTGIASDSEEEDDDLIRDFKRKFQKKDQWIMIKISNIVFCSFMFSDYLWEFEILWWKLCII